MSDLPPVLPRHLESARRAVEARWAQSFAPYYALGVRNGWSTPAEVEAEKASLLAEMTPLTAQVHACDERNRQLDVEIARRDVELAGKGVQIARNRATLADYSQRLFGPTPLQPARRVEATQTVPGPLRVIQGGLSAAPR